MFVQTCIVPEPFWALTAEEVPLAEMRDVVMIESGFVDKRLGTDVAVEGFWRRVNAHMIVERLFGFVGFVGALGARKDASWMLGFEMGFK